MRRSRLKTAGIPVICLLVLISILFLIHKVNAKIDMGAMYLLLLSSTNTLPPTPPTQPKSGPGGADYAYSLVEKEEHTFGDGQYKYWLYEPSTQKQSVKLPVIVFLHGWGAPKPFGYERWIEHIVKRGNILIYPRYQDGYITTFTSDAAAEIRAALKELETGDHPKPDLSRVAVVGHSLGGVIAANLTAMSATDDTLPAFRAVMVVEPGGRTLDVSVDYSLIPADTLLLCMVGEEDDLKEDAEYIYTHATSVGLENKDHLTVRSDYHGSPDLVAHHYAPAAPTPGTDLSDWLDLPVWLLRMLGLPEDIPDAEKLTDALDWYGFWKWFDGLTDAAFYGKNREYALGNIKEQKFMGYWSDGTPVTEPIVTDLICNGTWYKDNDNDGYSDGITNTTSCTRPTDYKEASKLISISGDCDDNDQNQNPGAAEICNGKDDNCNGETDEGLPVLTYYRDADNDTFGDPNNSTDACLQPDFYVTDSTDCDDSAAGINPGATEICDGVDNTCDGQVDEGCVFNNPPETDAGSDQTVVEGGTVTLDGSNSSDPDPGDSIASYQWIQTGGLPATLSDPTAAKHF